MLNPQPSQIVPPVHTRQDHRTPELFAEVHSILDRITLREDNTVVADADTWSQAKAISRRLGYIPRSNCPVCRMQVLDTLRMGVGLGPARKPAKESLRQQRIAICEACPVYHSDTRSCGRLVLDAIDPEPVVVDGRQVKPCGCFVPLKAASRSEHCPGNFWPLR